MVHSCITAAKCTHGMRYVAFRNVIYIIRLFVGITLVATVVLMVRVCVKWALLVVVRRQICQDFPKCFVLYG